jgi:hypothetical protein
MALTKEIVLDRIEIDEFGTINVRIASYINEDGVRISDGQFHRVAYIAGEELPTTIELPRGDTFNLGEAVLTRAEQAQIASRLAALAALLA